MSFLNKRFQVWMEYPICTKLFCRKEGLNAQSLNVLIPFNIMVVMIFWNYYLTCTTDPGGVPKDWKPKENQENIEIRRTTRTPRFCRTCNAYKPPRTHHCRTCPWTNNCVGYFNYGHFIRFVFWYGREPSSSEIVFLVLNYTAVIPVLFSVGILSMYHFYCMLSNTTTIENWEKDKVLMMVRKGKIKEVVFPYDVGVLANLQSVLGNNILFWCYPQQTIGSGIKFPISNEADPTIIWPPKDPTAKPPAPLPLKPWNRSRYHHVRRGSEGYVVRDLSLEERAMLVEEPYNTDNEDNNISSRTFDPHHNSDGSTLYSSNEEEIDEEISDNDYGDNERKLGNDVYDEFDDENYLEHVGVGESSDVFDNEEDYNNYNQDHSRNYHYNQSERYNYNNNNSSSNIDNVSDDDLSLSQKIIKKQLEAMNYKSNISNISNSNDPSSSTSGGSNNKIFGNNGKSTKID
ncbi:553_t:CDS:2 [Entrophospora sp. SA101]|nr:553_t:CDS:2 [Entrophospora sp. SA101]